MLASRDVTKAVAPIRQNSGMTSGRVLRAYIDESGQRGMGAGASPHFIMGAVIFFAGGETHADSVLSAIRRDTNRLPQHGLHWNKLKPHHKKTAAEHLGADSTALRYSSVVVCKRELARDGQFNQDMAYLLTLRYLLERLSWVARSNGAVLEYTLAHIKNFKLQNLREYETRLRALPADRCKISWDHVTPTGGVIDQPHRVPYLQIADMVTSAIGDAFNGNHQGATNTAYLEEIVRYFYRGAGNKGALTSYGLKMHPWRDTTKAAYPWVAAL